MTDALDDLRFWCQVVDDSHRTVLCPPGLESRLKSLVDSYNAGGTFEVKPCPWLPDGQVFVVDDGAIEASYRQFRQKMTRDWL